MKYTIHEITNPERTRWATEAIFETNDLAEAMAVWTALNSHRQYGCAIKRNDGEVDFGAGFGQPASGAKYCETCSAAGLERLAVAQCEYVLPGEPNVKHCGWLCEDCIHALDASEADIKLLRRNCIDTQGN